MAPTLFCICISGRILHFCQAHFRLWSSHISGTTGVPHHTQLLIEMGVSLTFCPGWPQTTISLITSSWVAGITGRNHQTQLLHITVIHGFCSICFKKTLENPRGFYWNLKKWIVMNFIFGYYELYLWLLWTFKNHHIGQIPLFLPWQQSNIISLCRNCKLKSL
jgi:hypothetical protein